MVHNMGMLKGRQRFVLVARGRQSCRLYRSYGSMRCCMHEQIIQLPSFDTRVGGQGSHGLPTVRWETDEVLLSPKGRS